MADCDPDFLLAEVRLVPPTMSPPRQPHHRPKRLRRTTCMIHDMPGAQCVHVHALEPGVVGEEAVRLGREDNWGRHSPSCVSISSISLWVCCCCCCCCCTKVVSLRRRWSSVDVTWWFISGGGVCAGTVASEPGPPSSLSWGASPLLRLLRRCLLRGPSGAAGPVWAALAAGWLLALCVVNLTKCLLAMRPMMSAGVVAPGASSTCQSAAVAAAGAGAAHARRPRDRGAAAGCSPGGLLDRGAHTRENKQDGGRAARCCRFCRSRRGGSKGADTTHRWAQAGTV